MTAAITGRARSRTSEAAAALLAACGCGLLAARPAILASSPHPLWTLTTLFLVLLAVGAAAPLPSVPASARIRAGDSRVVVAVGACAFAAGRVVAGGHAPARVTVPVVLANTLAAVAEEAWFRRLCFGLLAPAGTAVAIAGSTALFAAVHVAEYGVWILPLDVAAGALLGWQRAATRSWAAPALTHALANLFVLL